MAQPLHREEQHLHRAWKVLIGVACVGSVAGCVMILATGTSAAAVAGLPMVTAVLILVAAYLMFVRVVVTVEPGRVVVTTGYLGWPRWVFKGENIESYRPVTFSPLRDFLGWGVRHGTGNRMCINAAGNQGVEVKLRDRERTYIIGSDDPESLAAAISNATGIPPLDSKAASPTTEAERESAE